MNNENSTHTYHNNYTAKLINKTIQQIYLTTNTVSEATDEILLDDTPASKIINSTFVLDIRNTYKQAHPKLIRN